jgi:hypothetical protein
VDGVKKILPPKAHQVLLRFDFRVGPPLAGVPISPIKTVLI